MFLLRHRYLVGAHQRSKEIPQFLKELELLFQRGCRSRVLISDDNFTSNANIHALLAQIVSWQEEGTYPYRFFFQRDIHFTGDAELPRLLCEARFDDVFIGIESPSKPSLKSADKTQNLSVSIPEALSSLRDRGFRVIASMIVGFDTDSPDIFLQTYRFLHDNSLLFIYIHILTPSPHTVLYDRLLAEDRILHEYDPENPANVVFKPTMGAALLESGFIALNCALYHPPFYFRRCQEHLCKGERQSDLFAFSYSEAFTVAMRYLRRYLFTPYSFWFLLFLLKTALLKPRRIFQAFELGFYGARGYLLGRILRKRYPHYAHRVLAFLATVEHD